MTPGARVQAAIECLDDIFSGMPAEKTLTRWARRSRFAGSKDRAAVRDHVFDALRNRDSSAEIGGGLTGRSVMLGLTLLQGHVLGDVFTGLGHAPSILTAEEAAKFADLDPKTIAHIAANIWDMPDLWRDKLQASRPEQALDNAHALKARAPVDLRVNARKASLASAIEQLLEDGITAGPCTVSKTALRVLDGSRKVKNSQSYLNGIVELQDAGSQALAEMLPLNASMKTLDYCAGGGGKSLAIAALSDTRLFAHDSDDKRMKDIPNRAERSGASITCLQTSALVNQAPFDLVLCDAPCSGSGAWRRSPDAKWRLTEAQFQDLIELQHEILLNARPLVRRNGYLAYATCSLFSEENEAQVNRFLESAPEFSLIEQKSWTLLDGCDGFHLSVMQLKDA